MCSSQKECLFCDITKDYFMNDKGECVENKVDKCAIKGLKGCVSCE